MNPTEREAIAAERLAAVAAREAAYRREEAAVEKLDAFDAREMSAWLADEIASGRLGVTTSSWSGTTRIVGVSATRDLSGVKVEVRLHIQKAGAMTRIRSPGRRALRGLIEARHVVHVVQVDAKGGPILVRASEPYSAEGGQQMRVDRVGAQVRSETSAHRCKKPTDAMARGAAKSSGSEATVARAVRDAVLRAPVPMAAEAA